MDDELRERFAGGSRDGESSFGLPPRRHAGYGSSAGRGPGGTPPAGFPSGWSSTSAGLPAWGPAGGAAPADPATRPVRRRRAGAGMVTVALVAGLVGGGAGLGGAWAVLADARPAATPALGAVPASVGTAPIAGGTVAGAAAAAAPSTVDIRVVTARGVGEGSGVVLTADGAVLTNNHVVESGGTITVTLADGTQHAATVLGTSPSYDLAVLRMTDASGLPAATLGRSADLQVGQQVVAIGSPQGLAGTVTTGIVSALNRTVGVQGQNGQAIVYNGLQTDAPINPGNSGGPLVDLDGKVIGINSAILTAGQSTGSIGLGFTIPIDQARRVAQEILDTGAATKPVLGVQGAPDGPQQAGGGATIGAVQDGSAAVAAGLRAGDVVTKVGDARVENVADLVARIGAQTPGATVALTVQRDGQERTVDVTLGSTKDESPTTSAAPADVERPFGR